jgi:hypothetical protein
MLLGAEPSATTTGSLAAKSARAEPNEPQPEPWNCSIAAT